MKKLLLFFSVVVLFVSAAMAQTTTLSYQAVVRDSHNRLVPDADITVDVSISIGGTENTMRSGQSVQTTTGLFPFPLEEAAARGL